MKKLYIGAFLVLSSFMSYGQSLNHTDEVSLTLTDIAELRFKPGETAITTYNFDSGEDYENSVRSADAAILQVRANTDWMVTVKAGSANFAYSGSEIPAPQMPSTVLRIRNNPDPRIVLNTTDSPIATGTAGPWDDNQINLRYIARPRFEYPAGTYTIPVIYTVTNQ